MESGTGTYVDHEYWWACIKCGLKKLEIPKALSKWANPGVEHKDEATGKRFIAPAVIKANCPTCGTNTHFQAKEYEVLRTK